MRVFPRFLLGLISVFLYATPLHAAERTVLVFGDSLSAAYGLPREQGWAMLLEARLQQEKFRYRVINASISGETSAGGLSRIEKALTQHRPDVLILALGANDGLRGLPVKALRSNLEAMILAARKHSAQVLLVGMRMPPNMGVDYARSFNDSYAELAKKHRLAWVPFLMEGFADQPGYFLEDGLHPNAAGQRLMLQTVWKPLRKKLVREK